MKKSNLFLLFFIGACCLFLLSGCATVVSVTSIFVTNNENAFDIEPGQFRYADHTITVNYSNGKTEEIPLTEEMLPAYERLKLYQAGEQTVRVTYKNRSCEMKINVVRAKLDRLIEFNDKSAVYTGQPVSMEVEGDIPPGVTVRYPNGNSRTDAGTYTITALCYGDNYETAELKATLIIEKATYDISGIAFDDATFVYDGSPKSVEVTGKPSGVDVRYLIGERDTNSATNAGQYSVIAKFSSSDPNYHPIDDMSATLTIEKAKYPDFDPDFKDANLVYDSHSHSVEADLTKVPKGVETYYSIQKIKNAKGEEIEGEEEPNQNVATDAGTYLVRLYFVIADTVNYESIAPKSATLVIDRAEYVIENVFMDSQYFVYDGSPKSIALTGDAVGIPPVLPAGVSVGYSCRQVKDRLGNEVDGAASAGNSATEAGTYEITAHFSFSNENYNEISDISCILEIARAEHENVATVMNDLTVTYDGAAHSITASYSALPDTVTVRYTIKMTQTAAGDPIENPVETDGNSATEAGTYEICVIFEDLNENYVEIPSLTAVLVITEA